MRDIVTFNLKYSHIVLVIVYRYVLQRSAKLIKESERLAQIVDPQVDDDEVEQNQQNEYEDETDPEKNLWVEKYSPKRYTDLLSDEVRSHFSGNFAHISTVLCITL